MQVTSLKLPEQENLKKQKVHSMTSPSPASSPPPPPSLGLVYPPSPPALGETQASPAFVAPLSSPTPPPSLQNFTASATFIPWPPELTPTGKSVPPPSIIGDMPPPPSDAYQKPPSGRYPSPQTPPPSRQWAVSHPPPMPPPMLINGSTQPSPIGLAPHHQSSSNSNSSSPSSAPSIGLIVGISIAVAGGFFMIALVLLCFFQRRKQFSYFYDCESPPVKDPSYAVLPQHLNQKIPAPGLHHVKAPAKNFLLQPQGSSSGLLGSANSDSDSVFSPRALGNRAFGFPGNFTYEDLVLATGVFSEANLLGEGGFGYVHEGVLPNGRRIAVKQLKMGSQQGEREFKAEVETISRVHHRHLVSLLGYCITGLNRLLVYEFVPNRTLEFHLHGKKEPVMNWPTRLKIAIGSAKGLAYLHEDCNPTIIHRDIKAANILLDSNFEAKVSDFGLAKFFSDANHCVTHVSTRVVGTFGYLAPEYAQSGKTSDKSDVFSYGVMLLELITGRPPIIEPESSTTDSLVYWARPLLKSALEVGDFVALVDPRLEGNYNREELARMVACAAACVRQSSWLRPRMSQIIRALGGDISMEDLDEGARPGQSTVYGFDYDSDTFKEMNKLRMTLESKDNGQESSGGSNSEGDHHP